jgi:hypothetical protein
MALTLPSVVYVRKPTGLGPYGVSLRSPLDVVLEADTSFHVPKSLSSVLPNTPAAKAINSAIARIAVLILFLPSIV